MSLSVNDIPCTTVHFVGVLGSGMSAIAQFLRWADSTVTGSDRALEQSDTQRVRGCLRSIGCSLYPQDGSGISPHTSMVVASTAIEGTNPDIARARELEIPVVHRSDVLASIVASRRTIAVAGTSGKSTVSALCFDCLERCGMSPSLIGGANLASLVHRDAVGNAWHGSSDLLVIEADESDGTLVKYHPAMSVFLNLTRDHKPEDEIIGLFETLAGQSAEVLVNAEDPRCAALPHAASFGTCSGDTHPDRIDSTTPHIAFALDGQAYRSDLLGDYNLENIMAALCVCTRLGCSPRHLSEALPGAGVVQRRFNRVPTTRPVTVIDDFAHNPAKIAAALKAAQTLAPRVIALFQPHGFGPTRFMREELVATLTTTLRRDDQILLLPIFYAGGTVTRDISSADLAADLVAQGVHASAPERRQLVAADVAERVNDGDCVISMGARDPSLPALAREIASAVDTTAT